MIFKIFQDGKDNHSNHSIENIKHRYIHEKQRMIRSMAVSHKRSTISNKNNKNLHINQPEVRRMKSDLIQGKNELINEESLTWKDLAYNII